MDAAGQWRDAGGTVEQESAKILIILHRQGDAENAAIEQIMTIYKQRFIQVSVLRETGVVCAEF